MQPKQTSGAASRAAAAQAVMQVLEHGRSLSQAIPEATQALSSRDRALVQSICYAVMRQLPLFNFVLAELLEKPLKGQLKILHYLLLVGTCQILALSTSAHAAVAATVDAAVLLGRSRQKGLVNGVLRNLLRQQEDLLSAASARTDLSYAHPRWLLERIQAAYPQQWRDIVTANNAQAPMWLRVNTAKVEPSNYLAQLQAADIAAELSTEVPTAIRLAQPIDVYQLPGFEQGLISVQDIAAQRAAILLDAQSGERVLDCCAAPGGKTAHILERSHDLAQVIALDNDAHRLQRVTENLSRLQLAAKVLCADASEPKTWWDGTPFQRILLDAPCSATGVIRRHPDIKWLRRASDIDTLVAIQADILRSMWSVLAPGGTLLYATCSILPEENHKQIKSFVENNEDAIWCSLTQTEQHDLQFIPGQAGGDGFYYAKLEKRK